MTVRQIVVLGGVAAVVLLIIIGSIVGDGESSPTRDTRATATPRVKVDTKATAEAREQSTGPGVHE